MLLWKKEEINKKNKKELNIWLMSLLTSIQVFEAVQKIFKGRIIATIQVQLTTKLSVLLHFQLNAKYKEADNISLMFIC